MTTATDYEPRTYFSRIENALADFAPPLDAIPTIVEAVGSLTYTHVYIPESRAYIALETDDGGAPIAYIMSHVIALHPRDGVSSFIPLAPVDDAVVETAEQVAVPDEVAERGDVQVAVPEVVVCAGCFTRLPATGRCDYCD